MVCQERTVYRLSSLGAWRPEADFIELDVRGYKARALVTFLAFSRTQSHLRSNLAAMLWPGFPPSHARGSLRQALTEIRKSTEDGEVFFDADRTQIRVITGKLETDVELALSSLERGDISADLFESIALIPNFLLEFQSISNEFDDWVSGLRASLLERANEHLLQIYEGASFDNKSKFRAAQVAFRLDGFNEAAARAIISSLAEMNEISNAIRFYDELYAKLERELDTGPSLATQDLAAQLKLNLSANGGQSEHHTDSKTKMAPIDLAESAEISIAVLPFQELGPISLPNFVQLGLLDEITCSLAGLIAPSPISSNTMRRYMSNAPPSPSAVRRDTGARYVVTGSIRSDSEDAVVAVQMADATNEQVLWADVYRCGHAEIVNLDATIASKIVTSIVPTLHGAELVRTRTLTVDDLEPFQLVLRARELIFSLSPETFAEAGKLLKAAIKKGQYFAPAFAMLADWHSVRIWQGWSDNPGADQKILERYALKALSLKPSDGRVMAFLGHNQLIFSRKYSEAQGNFDNALSLMPGDSETLIWTVPGLTYNGRTDQAIENGERALKLSPFDPFHFRNQHFLSIAHYASGNFDRAAELGLSSFEDNATYVSNLRFTIASLIAGGRKESADDLVAYHHEIEPEFLVSELISRHPWRNDEKREQYGRHLVEAGLNA